MPSPLARLLTPADYRRMPWRNGGGTTTEIVVEHASSAAGAPAGERFLYRVSLADVASDGPFSRFDGYDRHIMLVEGAGMTLDCGPHGTLALDAPFTPRAFSGDWDVHGRLTAGAVRDFNLIADRARSTSSLACREVGERETLALAPFEACVLHVITGRLEGAPERATWVLRAERDGASFDLVPHATPTCRVVVARVRPR